jgi:hypothetical protein
MAYGNMPVSQPPEKKSNKAAIAVICSVIAVLVAAAVLVIIFTTKNKKPVKDTTVSTESNYETENDGEKTEEKMEKETEKETEEETKDASSAASGDKAKIQWYDFVFYDGEDFSVRFPCTVRRYFETVYEDADVASHFDIDSFTDGDTVKFSMMSDQYESADYVSYDYTFKATGDETDPWRYKAYKKVMYTKLSDNTEELDKCYLVPGICIGMSKEKVISLIGKPEPGSEETNTFIYTHGKYRMEINFDSTHQLITSVTVWFDY